MISLCKDSIFLYAVKIETNERFKFYIQSVKNKIFPWARISLDLKETNHIKLKFYENTNHFNIVP